jgi:Sec-independent protein translocase protein TatA
VTNIPARDPAWATMAAMPTDVGLVLLIILVVLVLYRGPKVLPGLGASLGRAVRGARRELNDKFDGPEDKPDPS